ncbi:hypothetical protein ACN47A_40085 [Myxococcus fulvus]|uniref:hypothetical protein n=1 Tax=Myxococcus fulvus TaxID=33 RepID=UPI003B9BB6A0
MSEETHLGRLAALLPPSSASAPGVTAATPTNSIRDAPKNVLLSLESAARELDTVHRLLALVDEKDRSLKRRDLRESMVNQGPWNPPPKDEAAQIIQMLHELRTRAYGKLVALRPSNGGAVRFYRIAQANYGFADIGVLNRLAPVCQQLVSAEVGDEVTLPAGTFEVLGVAHMERHTGLELTANADNFRRMELRHEELPTPAVFTDLARTFQASLEELLGQPMGEPQTATQWAPASVPPREVQRGDAERLGAHFYTRTTRLQEALMQRSEEGLAVILGVAGSGKTSVALGRTKVLCDQIPEANEARIYTPETAVGFVLSSQLCTYLEKTCQLLSLYDMPVQEYHQLRSRLFEYRRLDDSGFERHVAGGTGEHEGTMAWLRVVDASVAAHLSRALREALAQPPSERENARRTVARRTAAQEETLAVLWRGLSRSVESLTEQSLNLLRAGNRFHLEGLAARLDDVRAKFAQELEAAPTWTGVEHRELRQNVRNSVRERVIRALRLPEAYASALANPASLRQALEKLGGIREEEAAELVNRASGRVGDRRLSDADVDVLLSLAHVMSIGYRGRADRDPISHLAEPDWQSQVFIDEFQDFTEVQLFLMGAQAHPDRQTVTVVGDFHQKLSSGRRVDLAAAFPWSTPEEARPGILLENKRQTGPLARLSQRFRETVLGDLPGEAPTFGPGDIHPRIVGAERVELADTVYEEVVRIPRQLSVAVVCANENLARELERALRDRLGADFRQTRLSTRADLLARFYVHFTTALDAKGLEFDAVVVAGAEEFKLDDAAEANACYVALSRPRSVLSIVGDPSRLAPAWKQFASEGLVETVEPPPTN